MSVGLAMPEARPWAAHRASLSSRARPQGSSSEQPAPAPSRRLQVSLQPGNQQATSPNWWLTHQQATTNSRKAQGPEISPFRIKRAVTSGTRAPNSPRAQKRHTETLDFTSRHWEGSKFLINLSKLLVASFNLAPNRTRQEQILALPASRDGGTNRTRF
jgi:hypothetical protein